MSRMERLSEEFSITSPRGRRKKGRGGRRQKGAKGDKREGSACYKTVG